MSRTARLHYPGGIFHIISRCLNCERLITRPAHRKYYLDLLAESLAFTDATVLAWCVMGTHIHLVVRSGEEPLSRLMKPVNTGFARWLNARLSRFGPVFGDRYKSILVEEEPYLLELVRYVHNNPVRARVVSSPERSRWTSHQCYIGRRPIPDWLNVSLVLGMFDDAPRRAARQFSLFVGEGRHLPRSPELSGDGLQTLSRKRNRVAGDSFRVSDAILGSDAFVQKVLSQAKDASRVMKARLEEPADIKRKRPSIEDLIDGICSLLELEPWEFHQRPKARGPALARRILVWLWVRWCHGKQVDISRALKVPSSLVSRWYRAAIAEAPDIEELADKVIAAMP